ncbi:LOW QUALITY PROTEIN: Asp domain-containing protein, partial [Cephalotus follicularis]
VVIITLPPLGDPSSGKTITAFTLTDDFLLSQQTQQLQHDDQHQNNQSYNLLSQPPPQLDPENHSSSSNLFLGTPGKLLGLLGISVFALLFYSCMFSNPLQELKRNSNNDEQKPTSFIFPLYHKLSIQEISRSFGIKLEKLLDINKENLVVPVYDGVARPQNMNKMVSVNAVDSSAILPVRGNVYPDGLYFTYILIGNPRRPYFLDIDTGSDLTWIQCDAPCTSCAKGTNPLYKPTRGNILPFKDSECKEVQRNQEGGYCEACHQCDYEIEYADKSASLGVLARDDLHLMIANGSLTKINAVFGCAYDQQGLLLNTLVKTDGILGLSRAKVSLPSQLASQGIINNVAGHCLSTDTVGGGYMFIGDDFVPQWGMAWVPMLDSPSIGFYHTEIVKMNYGSSPFSLGDQDSRIGHVVFDTGSSYSYFTKEAYAELVDSLNELSGVELIQDASDPILPICWRAKFLIRSVLDVKQYFKTLTLQFGSKWWIVSKKLRIPPEGYLIISKKGNVCLGILDGSKVHDGSTILLGGISLRGQLVVYDNVKHKVGWAQSDCVKPQRFKSLPFFEG